MKRNVLFALLALLAANFLVVWGQSVVSFWKWRHLAPWLMPEPRYFLQSIVVLVPLLPLVLLRFRHGRKVLFLLLAVLVAHAAAYLAKAHVPGTRRHAYLAACDWAVETIRSDYRGPRRDVEPFFTCDDYHPKGRPVVAAHVNRVCYLLGGRSGANFLPQVSTAAPSYLRVTDFGLIDLPDYLVDETRRINRDWWSFADFEKLAERRFDGRDFVIYRRAVGADAKGGD